MTTTALQQDAPGRKPQILVVGDDRGTCDTISRILSKYGYAISTAGNGEEAVARCEQTVPDLVLLEAMLPDMSGYRACEALRRQADADVLPILMLAGLDDIAAVDQAFDAGATDFITQPINWSLLAQRVRYALRNRQRSPRVRDHDIALADITPADTAQAKPPGHWNIDPDSGHITLSEQARQLLHLASPQPYYTLAGMLGLVHRDDLARVNAALDNAISTGMPYQIDHRMVLADGTEIMVRQQGESARDAVTGLSRILGTIQDISGQDIGGQIQPQTTGTHA